MPKLQDLVCAVNGVTQGVRGALKGTVSAVPSVQPPTVVERDRREKPPDRFLVPIFVGATVFGLLYWELRTSRMQAFLLTAAGQRMAYTVIQGAGSSSVLAGDGPYDRRLGYTGLPSMLDRLKKGGFHVESQAHPSTLLRLARVAGAYPIYSEKSQGGLEILDRSGASLYAKSYPERIYPSFDSIPTIVTNSLLFVENREVLETNTPYRNPALEWSRLGKAVVDVTWHRIDQGHPISGGSTLATQLEKIRHSPNGLTASGTEKLRQILSASLRGYRSGEDTIETRRGIVRDYINSLPLSASPGYGEVLGLGDGLWAWHGADFDEVNRLLRDPERSLADPALARKTAIAYREALGLILAVNRPSYYLRGDFDRLNERVDSYLRIMTDAGIVPPKLRDASLAVRPTRLNAAPLLPTPSLTERKSTEPVRAALLRALGIDSNYELDRLDLEATTTLDANLTRAAAQTLQDLTTQKAAAAAGLTGERMLGAGRQSESVIYSFTLFERGKDANYLRAQVDNFGGALNISEGSKLELGSTAKLRTLTTYLDTIGELHAAHAGKSRAELEAIPASQREDRLSTWAIEYLTTTSDRSLPAMLEAAMDRTYSASPGEAFFTGGGLHVFSNFESRDNGRMMPVREAFHRSVNLVFIRMMRDLVQHSIPQVEPEFSAIMSDIDHPRRKEYLHRFADTEGREFQRRFYRRYRGLTPDQALISLLHEKPPAPFRLSVIFRALKPEARLEEFSSFLRSQPQGRSLTPKDMNDLYERYTPGKFNLQDQGYLARVHPLELWVVTYLRDHPNADFREVVEASANERQEVYRWLRRPSRKRGQDVRIRTLVEADTFKVIHKYWEKQGYPFASLVPSYATALGSSGDTPAALAELAGIILNDGVYRPADKFERLHFARATPMETVLSKQPGEARRVLPAAVAAVLHKEMLGVVEKGTARRAFGSVVLNSGKQVEIGGKTGTGDNRIGRSKVVNRTGTFVFTVGDRFFGTVVAYVPGPEAASYSFTSSLPVQVFRQLVPSFLPLVEERSQSVNSM